MVNGDSRLPFTIYHFLFTKELLLLALVLLGGGVAGVVAGGLLLGLVLVEHGLYDRAVAGRGLDVSLLAELAQVLLVLLVGALLRHDAADEVLLEGVVALVDAQDHVALVGLDGVGEAAGPHVLDGRRDLLRQVGDEEPARLAVGVGEHALGLFRLLVLG